MKNKIVVIDDDKGFLEEIRELLSSAGYDVRCASDGASAIAITTAVKPDLVLVDLKIPLMSGFEIASLLKHASATSDIPIIAMSACYTLKEHEFLASICGVKKFFPKPMDPEKILSEVNSILNGQADQMTK
jgi:chemosensory pili system protein ChpA (sensor histidine kinase/response regulator)